MFFDREEKYDTPFTFSTESVLLDFREGTCVRTHNSLTVLVPSQGIFFSDHKQKVAFVT
jgi:hypothetical protein